MQLPPIPPLDAGSRAAALRRLDSLTKPPGSLGRLEELAAWLAGVQARSLPYIGRRVICVVAADHGVARQAVSAYPAEVTRQMVENFRRGGAAINVLAAQADAALVVVDAGVASMPRPGTDLISRRIGQGTNDFTQGPAMTVQQAERCIRVGLELAQTLEADVVGCGEMGIGNTTAASAITAAWLGVAPELTTGPGTGLDEAGLARKREAVLRALAVNQPRPGDALDVLRTVGGFEIGVLAGLMVGAAAARRAIVLDGFISGAAALLAAGLSPSSRFYMVASHLSTEPGHRLILEHLGLEPLLNLRLRLGEGTGAALALPLLDAACAILREMATFAEAGVATAEEAAHG